jgi:hypothetical protein
VETVSTPSDKDRAYNWLKLHDLHKGPWGRETTLAALFGIIRREEREGCAKDVEGLIYPESELDEEHARANDVLKTAASAVRHCAEDMRAPRIENELEQVRAAGRAFIRQSLGHSGSCCTFDENGVPDLDGHYRVIVTRESCKCDEVTKAFRDAVGAWHPREWETPR